MKKLLIIILLISPLYAFEESGNLAQDFRYNFSLNPRGIESFLSTIAYTQEEKNKTFIGSFKIPLTSSLYGNIQVQSGEVTEGIGPIGYLGLFGKSESSLANSGKLLLGLTWTNFFRKATQCGFDILKLRERISEKNNIHHYRSPEDLKEVPESYNYFIYISKPKNRLSIFNDLKLKDNWKSILESIFGENEKDSIQKVADVLKSSKDLDEFKKRIVDLVPTIDDLDLKTKYVGVINEIENLEMTANADAIKETVVKFNLYQYTKLDEIIDENRIEIDNALNNLYRNVLILSFNAGTNFARIDYYNPTDAYKKNKDSFYGFTFQGKVGYLLGRTSLIGCAFEYERRSKLPQLRTIIQELKISNSIIDQNTLESQQWFLEPMKRISGSTLIIEYRRIFPKYVSINPFLEADFEGQQIRQIKLCINLFASFDAERKWNIGVQPAIGRILNDDKKYEYNAGVAFFLATAFQLD
jgi:hypothetical protein